MRYSFIIPVYNTEKYLQECLDSILGQSYTDFEVIIVDDGSTDSSAEICRNYLEKDKRVRFKQITNGGPARIRNIGIKESVGDYIWFIDSDDKLSSNTVLFDINQILIKSSPDIMFFLSNNYNEDYSQLLKEQREYKYDGFLDESGEKLLIDLKNSANIMALATSPVNKIFKRNVLQEKKLFFVENYRWHAEDEFLNKVIANSKGIYFYNKEVYQVRIRPKSITTTINSDILEKKICTKIDLSARCLKYFCNGDFSEDLKSVMITYYSYYYLFAFRDYFRITSRNQKKRIKKFISKNNFVIKTMTKADSKNLRILSKIYSFLGLNLFLYCVKKRYKI